jgi:hypothetical protein
MVMVWLGQSAACDGPHAAIQVTSNAAANREYRRHPMIPSHLRARESSAFNSA